MFSNNFNFSLTDKEPTIPKTIKTASDKIQGTRMEISFKGNKKLPIIENTKLLELCICLRKLKNIKIFDHSINIEDSSEKRIITIDAKRYIFKKYTHSFIIDNEVAISERSNGYNEISPEQNISCYVPENNNQSEYKLYTGLPTKHLVKIPLVIDAPFALTTSREEIELGCSSWNDIIRQEMYNSIIEIIKAHKEIDKANVLRYINYFGEWNGRSTTYKNSFSDCMYLNEVDFVSMLKAVEFIPTFDSNVFACPQVWSALFYPQVLNILFTKGVFGSVQPTKAINISEKFVSKINALGCREASPYEAFDVIEQLAEENIRDEKFRGKLYELLITDIYRDRFKDRISKLSMIPVYGKRAGIVEYTSGDSPDIYVKKGTEVSGADYFVLNEKLLSKSDCEKILNKNINEMNAEWERFRFNNDLRKSLQNGNNVKSLYQQLINYFAQGTFRKFDSRGVLLDKKEYIPLKNQFGEITQNKLFICNQPVGYFDIEVIKKISVHSECADFARYIQCDDLKTITYDDLCYNKELTPDDVEAFCDDYFMHGQEILIKFYNAGLLSEHLLREYGLGYLSMGSSAESDGDYDFEFPCEPVENMLQIKSHIKKQMSHPIHIIQVQEIRTVQKCQINAGKTFSLNSNDARKDALNRYKPDGVYGRCFCQMCHKVKSNGLIEVNNLEIKPQLYFPQMRIALCLECSKRFEELRNNQNIRDEFIKNIINANTTYKEPIDINIGSEKISFTAKHLAEIQEIMENVANLEKQAITV